MICRAVDTLQGNDTLPIYVISGAWHAQIEDALRGYKNVEILHNPYWQIGLGKSIALATHTISKAHSLEGILFMLADQVELSATHINTLITHFNPISSRITHSKGVSALACDLTSLPLTVNVTIACPLIKALNICCAIHRLTLIPFYLSRQAQISTLNSN